MSVFRLKEVISSHDAKVWLHLDRKIYRDAPNWVCPLDNDIEKVFDPERNHLFEEGEAIRWVAYNAEGECVGRIAAFYDNEHAYSYEQPTGGCGFFEAINDQELANQLFDAARMWLVSRGMEAMDGPINFGSRDAWWGLLVEGYEHQPLFENPYHLPYYKALFENYGFQNFFNQNSYLWRVYEDDLSEIAKSKAERVAATAEYRVEDIRHTDLNVAAEEIDLKNPKANTRNAGFTNEERQKMKNLKIYMYIC